MPNEITISYTPGPNLDPVNATLIGWPTPLKFVSCFLINSGFFKKYIILDEVNFANDDLKLIDENAKKIIAEFKNEIISLNTLNKESLEPIVNGLIKKHDTNFKGVGQPIRVALTGSKFGPGLYDIVISLGKEEIEKRLSSKIIT